MAVPGASTFKGLATTGLLSGLTNADPNAGVIERVGSGALQAAVNPLVGLATEKVLGTDLAARGIGKLAADTKEESRQQLAQGGFGVQGRD